jgi:energy-coupling factor transporter ATP-binding protein EcfA2
VSHLSGGEHRALALAHVDTSDKRVFLLDEPLSALDARRTEEAVARIRGIHGRTGTTLLLAVPSACVDAAGCSGSSSDVLERTGDP